MEKIEGGWGFLVLFFLIGLGLVAYSFSSGSFAVVFTIGIVFLFVSLLPLTTLFIEHYMKHRESMTYSMSALLIVMGVVIAAVAGLYSLGIVLALLGALILAVKLFFFRAAKDITKL